MSSLADQFDFNDELSLDELAAISDRLDDIEAAIDEHTEELNRIDRLDETIDTRDRALGCSPSACSGS